jgi:hypothetical protein
LLLLLLCFWYEHCLQVTGLGRVDVAPTSGCRCCGLLEGIDVN